MMGIFIRKLTTSAISFLFTFDINRKMFNFSSFGWLMYFKRYIFIYAIKVRTNSVKWKLIIIYFVLNKRKNKSTIFKAVHSFTKPKKTKSVATFYKILELLVKK